MSSPHYYPKDGTVSHIAVEYLKSRPRGVLVTTKDLAAVCQVATPTFQMRVASAIKHGLLRQKRISPRKTLWYLGYPEDHGYDPDPRIPNVEHDPQGVRLPFLPKLAPVEVAPPIERPWRLALDFAGDEPDDAPEDVYTPPAFGPSPGPAYRPDVEPEPLITDEEDAEDIPHVSPSRSLSDQSRSRVGFSTFDLVTTGRRIEDVLADPSLPAWRASQLTSAMQNKQAQLVARFRDLLGSSDKLVTSDPHRSVARLLEVARLVREQAPKSRFKGVEVDLAIHRELNEIGEVVERAIANLEATLQTMIDLQ